MAGNSMEWCQRVWRWVRNCILSYDQFGCRDLLSATFTFISAVPFEMFARFPATGLRSLISNNVPAEERGR